MKRAGEVKVVEAEIVIKLAEPRSTDIKVAKSRKIEIEGGASCFSSARTTRHCVSLFAVQRKVPARVLVVVKITKSFKCLDELCPISLEAFNVKNMARLIRRVFRVA